MASKNRLVGESLPTIVARVRPQSGMRLEMSVEAELARERLPRAHLTLEGPRLLADRRAAAALELGLVVPSHVVHQTRLVREHLGADLADERLLPSVQSDVLDERRLERELPAAVVAREARVRLRVALLDVPREVARRLELAVAHLADERRPGRVALHVPAPRVAVRELAAAVLARERLRPGVRPVVDLKGHLLRERPVAAVTTVRLLLLVGVRMFAEMIAPHESLAATIATKRSFAGMNSCVLIQLSLLRKRSRAILAYVLSFADSAQHVDIG